MTIIIALIVFGIIVLVHEFGHFIVAKKSGVKIHEFAIGMGPKLIGIKKGETDYTIRILPLGGFVRMEGEDENSSDPRSFNNKNIFQRIAIIFAGPFMNFLLAIVLFAFIFMYQGVPGTTIKQTLPNLPAKEVGIKAGDTIVEINNIKVNSWDEVSKEITNSQGKKINIKISRNEELKSYDIIPQKQNGRIMIGIEPKFEKNIFLSLKYSIKQTVFFLEQMINFLGNAISGNASFKDVAGPVGIVNIVGKVAKTGFISLVSFAAIISLNLGLMNLLPIPALDGGRILLLLVELVRGKKIDPDKEGFIHFVGFVALMLLMVVITYKDIARLFSK